MNKNLAFSKKKKKKKKKSLLQERPVLHELLFYCSAVTPTSRSCNFLCKFPNFKGPINLKIGVYEHCFTNTKQVCVSPWLTVSRVHHWTAQHSIRSIHSPSVVSALSRSSATATARSCRFRSPCSNSSKRSLVDLEPASRISHTT